MSWATENVRLVAFTVGPVQQNAQALWSKAISGSVDSFATLGPGWTSASAQRSPDERIEVQVLPNRVDLIISGGIKPDPAGNVMPAAISKPSEAFKFGVEHLPKLVGGLTVSRAALVVQNYHEAPDTAAASAILSTRIPGLPIVSETSDVSFQANRRTTCKTVKNVQINNFCRWFVAQRLSIQFQVSAGGVANVNNMPTGTTNTLAVIEVLDVNTVPESVIPASKMMPLLQELTAQYDDLKARGNVALV